MSFTIASLPLVNASLNALATVLLVIGYVCIRRRRIRAHRLAMSAAFLTSVVFLVSYLIYHAHAGSRPFPGRGSIRAVYFTILISHIVLAAAIPPLARVTLWRAYRDAVPNVLTSARTLEECERAAVQSPSRV